MTSTSRVSPIAGVVAAICGALRATRDVAKPALAAAAAAVYYWFAAPGVGEAVGLSAGGGIALRFVALGLVGWWVAAWLTRRRRA